MFCYNARMLQRFLNIWRPENFHLHHRLHAGSGRIAFEGWYFKIVDAAGSGPLALIPGVFLGNDPHAFIQVLDGRLGEAHYHRFPVEDFHADRKVFDVRIGDNRFWDGGVDVALADAAGGPGSQLSGSVRFGEWSRWPVTFTQPGVMGPYAFIPMMECNHGILSMDHALSGSLTLDDRDTCYDGGRGYIEKDWGHGFPQGYVWTQSNHFDEPGISVSASVARIPWMTGAFRGFLVGFLHAGTLHRFTTYNGSQIDRLAIDDTHMNLTIRNRTHRLEVRAEKKQGGVLHAPYGTEMIARVAETMSSTVYVRLTERKSKALVYSGAGANACLEMQGNLDFISDRVPSGIRSMPQKIGSAQRLPNASRSLAPETETKHR